VFTSVRSDESNQNESFSKNACNGPTDNCTTPAQRVFYVVRDIERRVKRVCDIRVLNLSRGVASSGALYPASVLSLLFFLKKRCHSVERLVVGGRKREPVPLSVCRSLFYIVPSRLGPGRRRRRRVGAIYRTSRR